MSITLYEISEEYRRAAETLSDLDLPEEVIADTLESLAFPLEQKAINVAAFIRNIEATANSIKQAEEGLAKRRKAMERRADSLKAYLQFNMQQTGINKIESPLFSLSIRDNPPAVIIDDANLIPADYMREPVIPPPAPDKNLIKKALTDGFVVPGAHLERGRRLEIK